MDYSVKSIYNLLTIIITLVPFLVFSQDIGTDYWYISSPELRYNLTEKVEIRLRPDVDGNSSGSYLKSSKNSSESDKSNSTATNSRYSFSRKGSQVSKSEGDGYWQ